MSASMSSLLRRPEPAARAADPRTSRARLIVCALALALAPVLLLLAGLVSVETSDNAVKAAGQIAAHRNRFLVGELLFALGTAALIPGALALASLVRARGAAWMSTGACMIALGGGAMSVGIYTYVSVGFIGTGKGFPRNAFETLLDRGQNSAITGLPFVLGAGALLGMIAAAVGLIRARAVPLWQPIVLIIAPVLTFASSGGVLGAVLTIPMLVVLWALAFEVVRSDARPAAPRSIDVTDGAQMPAPRSGSERTSGTSADRVS